MDMSGGWWSKMSSKISCCPRSVKSNKVTSGAWESHMTWPAFLEKATGERSLPNFDWKWLLVWNRIWARHLSLLRVTAFVERLWLVAPLLVAEVITTLVPGPWSFVLAQVLVEGKTQQLALRRFHNTARWNVDTGRAFVLLGRFRRRLIASLVRVGGSRLGWLLLDRHGYQMWHPLRRSAQCFQLSAQWSWNLARIATTPKLLDARMNICLSHSMICWSVTDANHWGWDCSYDRKRCCTHSSISLKEHNLAWSMATDRLWNALRRSSSELTAQDGCALRRYFYATTGVKCNFWISLHTLNLESGLYIPQVWSRSTRSAPALTHVSTRPWLGVTSGEKINPMSLSSCFVCLDWPLAVGSLRN